MKKTFVIVLTAALLLVLVGCQGSTPTPSGTTPISTGIDSQTYKVPPAGKLKTTYAEGDLHIGGYHWTYTSADGNEVATITDQASRPISKELLTPGITNNQPTGNTDSAGYRVTPVWEVAPTSVTCACWSDAVWEDSCVPEESVLTQSDFSFYAKPGSYIYEIVATWEDVGTGYYGTAYYYVYIISVYPVYAEQSSDIAEPRKPVIYLYPEVETEVSVQLFLDGKLTCTYPAYNTGWWVTAAPDGTLTDASGQTYSYLYWEGETHTQWDMTEGFCIKGEDTAAFLEDALAKLGLNRREANEFIVYWLPLMERNPYNIITFQTDAYTDNAILLVDPAPDTLIRVFMVWQATDSFVELPPQKLTAPDRIGFTVVEWGGTETSQ